MELACEVEHKEEDNELVSGNDPPCREPEQDIDALSTRQQDKFKG